MSQQLDASDHGPKLGAVGVIGACYYVEPGRFSTLAQQVVQALGGEIAYRRFVAMRPSTNATSDQAVTWLNAAGPHLDISAYGAAILDAPAAEAYLVFNDTFFVKHPWQLMARRLGELKPLLVSMAGPAAAGEVHPSNDLLLIDKQNPTRQHLSTFCFLLNHPARSIFLQILADLPNEVGDISTWLKEKVEQYPSLGQLIHVHLMAPANPWSWKGAASAAVSSDLRMRKAVTVAVEYIFSAQLLASGGAVLPVNHALDYRIQARFTQMARRFGLP